MSSRASYGSPAAFRRALTDKLRSIAKPHGPWPLADLQRQFAYDRLLVRLYLHDEGWILKGATALLARRIAVRHTVDVDVYRKANPADAERDIRQALALDAGDWFEFKTGPARPIADGVDGLRIPIDALVGAVTWARFHVDVVAQGIRMTGEPDIVPALMTIDMGLVQPSYRAYPVVDHIADKLCAILERQGPAKRPSTRFKDLVDLVVLVHHVRPSADDQYRAWTSEAARRGIPPPHRFDVPDEALWQAGYGAEVKRSSLPFARTLAEALERVRPFADPLLASGARGIWDPGRRAWTSTKEVLPSI
jgi:hypothetical protein